MIWSRISSGSIDIPPRSVTERVFKEFAARMNSRSRAFSRSGRRSGLMTFQRLVSSFKDILLPKVLGADPAIILGVQDA
jgi:hypothetical protein